jgi:hypothetical protein
MKIRALTDIKHHPYYLTKDDVVTIPDGVGSELVSNGWAGNVDSGDQNQPSAGEITLDIHGAGHNASDTMGE